MKDAPYRGFVESFMKQFIKDFKQSCKKKNEEEIIGSFLWAQQNGKLIQYCAFVLNIDIILFKEMLLETLHKIYTDSTGEKFRMEITKISYKVEQQELLYIPY